MNRLSFLRKPIKPLLHGLLLALILGAALVFGLQAALDSLALDYAMDAYAYVGTVNLHGRTASRTEPLPEELVDKLRNSPLVADLEIRQTQAAILDSHATVPDIMMSTNRLNQRYFAEITIIGDHTTPNQTGPFVYGVYSARLDKQWGASTIGLTSLTVVYIHTQEQPHLKPGTELFIIGNYYEEHAGVRTNYIMLFTPEGRTAMMGGNAASPDDPMVQNPYVVIPGDLEEDQREPFILDWMEETGIMPLYQRYTELGSAMTVRRVSDMSLLSYVSKGRIYMVQGRPLYARDAGQKVCLVSQNLSLRNRFMVGDTITLRLADGCYTIAQETPGGGWESGMPTSQEAMLHYGPAEEYTIVGIYYQLGRDASDPNFFGHNDIFLPPEEQESDQIARPYNLSFRISGPNQESFTTEFGTWPEAEGYDLKLVDNGWDEAQDSFYAMLDRKNLMTVCALLAFLAAALTYGLLTWQHHRYEYGLLRLLGAYRREAVRIYRWGFPVPALPGAAAALAGAWCVYILWLKEALYNAAPLKMPENWQVLALLSLWALAALLASRGLVAILTRLRDNRSILRLMEEGKA